MTNTNMELIKRLTGNHFEYADIPQLYVQIMRVKEHVEAKRGQEISFERALFIWQDDIYTPIMERILSDNLLRFAGRKLTKAELFFELYDKAEESALNDLDIIMDTFIKERTTKVQRFVNHLIA